MNKYNLLFEKITSNPISLFLLFILIIISIIPLRGLWAPDEARYAEVAREMNESGEYIVPQLNGTTYSEKPPLFFWAIHIFSLPFGEVTEFSAKLPSMFGGLFSVILTYLIAYNLSKDKKTAILSSLLYLSTLKILYQSQFGQIDMFLSALVLLQIFIFLKNLENKNIKNSIYLGIAGSLSILAKGPVGVIPVILILLLTSLFKMDKTILKSIKWLPYLISLLSPVIIWLFLAYIKAGTTYLRTILFHQNVERYVTPWHHTQPPYYYLLVILAEFLPFSLLLFGAILNVIKNKLWKNTKLQLIIAWIVSYLLFFSLSSGKRDVYIIPIYPALSILLCFILTMFSEKIKPNKKIGLAVAVLCWIGIIEGSFYYIYKSSSLLSLPKIPIISISVLVMILLGFCLLFAFENKIKEYLTVLSLANLIIFTTGSFLIFPSLDGVKTPRAFGEIVKILSVKGAKAGQYPSLVPSVLFYSRTKVRVFHEGEEKEALRFFKAGNTLLIKENIWPREIKIPQKMIALRHPIGDDEYILLSR